MHGPPAHFFPRCARTAFSTGSDEPPPLFPDEALTVQDAVASRQREFALGRWCARKALAELGVPAQSIPVARYRSPVWPSDVVGSISHCKGFVGAVVARTDCLDALGFDAEQSEPLNADIVPLVCTPPEIAWMHTWTDGRELQRAKLIFSAKEAVHKCMWPRFGELLDFLDVTLELDLARNEFSARATASGARTGVKTAANLVHLVGRLAVTERLVFTCAFVESSPGSATT
ncbi:MAG: 4'-phosphopantetheinyl transferase superfamily protein [bacterium]